MANSKINVNLNVVGLDGLSNLISSLADNIDKLPDDVVNAMDELYEYNSGDVSKMACGRDVTVLVDGKENHHVASVNERLKRLRVEVLKGGRPLIENDEIVLEEIYPKSFRLCAGGEVLIEW